MFKKIIPMLFGFALVVQAQANNQEMVEEQEVKVAEVEATKLDDAALQEIIKAVQEALAEKSEAGSSSKKKTFFEQYKKEIIAACILIPVTIGGGVVVAARNDKLPRSMRKLLPKWKILKKQPGYALYKDAKGGSYFDKDDKDDNLFSSSSYVYNQEPYSGYDNNSNYYSSSTQYSSNSPFSSSRVSGLSDSYD